MGTIHQLPPTLISKIAAGEVIERPAYAVKELIENSIDAGATHIRIDVEQSGLKSIVVTDNGVGMDPDDVVMSIRHHATSKLRTEEQLGSVRTLGFRGEALSSLAAVSDLIIQSKQRTARIGTILEIREGTVEQVGKVGMPEGTMVTAERLFQNVPARKHFMKSGPTEFRHILDVVTAEALTHPEIRFYFTHNRKPILDVPVHTDRMERLKSLLGRDAVDQFVPVSAELPYVSMEGFISKPQLSTTSISNSFLFINNRSVRNKSVLSAVRESYGTLLQPQSHPVFVLFLTMPYEAVDVNVHPRKEEVRFVDAGSVISAVKEGVSTTLAVKDLTFHDTRWKRSTRQLYGVNRETPTVRDGVTDSYAAEVLRAEIMPSSPEGMTVSPHDLIQLHNTYIVYQSAGGIVMVDQHAAHERVLYEQFLRAYTAKRGNDTQFVLPASVMLQLGIREAETVRLSLSSFTDLGFDLHEYGANTFVVTAVPQLFRDRNIGELVREMIEDIMVYNKVKDIDNRTLRMLAYLACRGAIKAGDALTKEQMKKLLEELDRTPNNSTCPHGRPTRIEVPIREWHRKFHRV